ncbi:MAG: pantoate--beta-alanine ligase [Solirubrobacterales bacterium]|nr:pantoate--beta-alanine ligase [Solirubrobacterales bacterium]
MRTVRTVAELRAALTAPRRAGKTIGLVPTMGAFHRGHLSLMQSAREDCDVVVVSLFVNPGQFNESGDLNAYPRDERRDAMLASEIGVDLLFVPSVEEVYPPDFATTVSVAEVSEPLEGAVRGREHFDAVATIVTKLFNMASPDVAYFGQKDAQQALVIKRLVRDLNMAVRIEVCETVREADGLAMSSRNAHLSEGDRKRATALHRALEAARTSSARGAKEISEVLESARAELRGVDIEADYLELVSPETLTPVKRLDGEVLAVIAARVNGTRLIDNETINTNWRR